MKRTIAFILAVAMVLTLVPVTALAAEGITVSTVKTDFYVGESITTSNFTVTYEDASGNKFDVGSDFQINGKSSVSFKKPGTQTLTISYETEGGTVLSASVSDVKIHAKEDYIAVSLSTAGAARAFVAGDTVSQADFVVEFYKADATAAEAALTADQFSVSPTTLAAGDNTITVTYGSLKGSYTITGVAPKNDPQLIVTGEAKTKYGLGETFDKTGLTFTYQPRNSASDAQVDVTGTITWTPTDVFSEIGDKTITFTYTDPVTGDTVTETLNVTVVGQVNKFEITGAVQQFYAGQTFDPTGLTATVYDYQEQVLVNHVFGVDADSADFTWSKTPLMAGQTSIDIVYNHQATGETIKRAVDINVVAKLAKLTHTAGDIKTYYVGEEFDPTGLEFTLLYSDGSTEVFSGATLGSYAKLSWPAGVFTAAGTYTLPVSYKDDVTGETVSCDLLIVIKDPKAAKIQAATVVPELKVVVGDNFDPDQLFEVTFQKANTEGFERISYTNGDYTISPAPASFTTEGVQTFTITKDGVSATVTVEVLPVIKLMTVAGAGNLDIYGGEEFDPTGLEFTVYYNMGSTWNKERKQETYGKDGDYSSFEWAKDKLLKGTKTITMTFTDAKTGAKAAKEIEFTVKPLLKELVVENTAAKKFYADETFDADGLTMTVKLNNGEADLVLTKDDVTFDKDELKAGKNQSIVLSYTHKDSGETITTEFVFDVQATTYELQAATSGPKKTNYSEGEMFDPAGISWQVIKNGDTANPITVTSGFKTYPDRELTPADTSVTVVYGNIAQVYDIEVSGRTLVSIAVTQAPDAASFHVGQRFDPEGMIVTATYNNKTTSEVSEFTYDSAPFVETDIGTKEIKLTYKEGGVTAETTYKATVVAAPIRAASLVLSKSTLQLVESKDETIAATIYPTNATNQSLIWTSSDTSVARVDQSGKITAVGAGACVISANTTDGSNRYADCYVVVAGKVDVSKLVLKASTMELLVGDTTTLTATVEPTNATWNVANWTTSNPEIVSVNADGQIKGEKVGSATITASADGVEASVTITVVKELTKYGSVVNCSRRVNVRSAASGSAKVLGYAYLGTSYVVTGEEGNWYEIVYNGDTAYIWKEYLEVASKSYVSDSESTGSTDNSNGLTPNNGTTSTVYTKLKVVNCKRYVYVRKGPSTATSKAGHAKPGEEYKLLGQSGTWYIIEFNGTQAYISSQFGQLS